MKKYKFLIKKSKELEINLCAKNHSEAMFKLLERAVMKDKEFFIDDNKDKKDLYIALVKIIDENGKENEKDYDDFYEENSFFITRDYDEKDKNIEENEEDFTAEYDEIICEKCGNCIRLDKNLLS